MAVGNYYQVRFRQTFQGANVDNTQFYRQATSVGLGNKAQLLAEAWYGQFASLFSALQNENCLYQYVDVINLNIDTENYRLDVTGSVINGGTAEDEPMGEWEALVFTKTPQSRSFKSGLFRVRGLDEFIFNGKVLNAAYTDEVEAMRLAINDVVTDTDGGTYTPIILRRERVPENPEEEFISWNYSHTLSTGTVFKGRGHKVNNQ